jgi:tetratricopeptide (TPR) repeat protein
MTLEPKQLDAQGKRAFENKKFTEAAEYFQLAANGYTQGRAGLLAAEMMNNASVAFLQAGKAQEALQAALSTDAVFASANDVKKQAMSLGNQAAALEALGRNDEAIEKYQQSADLFGQINEGDLRAMVLKSVAAIQLKTGKITESAFKMVGSLEVKDKPSIFERIVRFFLRFFVK